MKRETLGELIANAVSHGLGIALAISATVLLVIRATSTVEVISVVIFGFALLLLYTASTLYHAFPGSMKRVVNVFQRLDHSAIYVLIAGTYTPFVMVLVPNGQGYVLLGVLWGTAIFGVVLKSIWIHRFKWVHVAIYVLMGWSVMFIWPDVRAVISPLTLRWLILGGVAYTVGVAFYAAKFLFTHLVWHIFVLAGSLMHVISIYTIL